MPFNILLAISTVYMVLNINLLVFYHERRSLICYLFFIDSEWHTVAVCARGCFLAFSRCLLRGFRQGFERLVDLY